MQHTVVPHFLHFPLFIVVPLFVFEPLTFNISLLLLHFMQYPSIISTLLYYPLYILIPVPGLEPGTSRYQLTIFHPLGLNTQSNSEFIYSRALYH